MAGMHESSPASLVTAEPASKREAILRAALQVFAENGVNGVAVPQIAARAGVGTGTIYRYFPGKEALVNQLFREQKQALAQRLGTIGCTACGGTVDIRRDHACPWCRSALALLDPEAVDRAMQRYGQQIRQRQEARTPDALADALVALERQNAREERARQRERLEGRQSGGLDQFDLLSAGIDLVWSMLRR